MNVAQYIGTFTATVLLAGLTVRWWMSGHTLEVEIRGGDNDMDCVCDAFSLPDIGQRDPGADALQLVRDALGR